MREAILIALLVMFGGACGALATFWWAKVRPAKCAFCAAVNAIMERNIVSARDGVA